MTKEFVTVRGLPFHLRERAGEWLMLQQIAAETGVPVERLVTNHAACAT
ncbi:MAG: hypothetical protein LBK71_05375 [Verrucomicrobiales bacterium]|jgi:hypothetical protein|nr:hypothetical protein [Verrucomicrobiales bacterium]